jgi:hypothetical protein
VPGQSETQGLTFYGHAQVIVRDEAMNERKADDLPTVSTVRSGGATLPGREGQSAAQIRLD